MNYCKNLSKEEKKIQKHYLKSKLIRPDSPKDIIDYQNVKNKWITKMERIGQRYEETL